MFLGSCRYKLGDDEKIFAEIIDVLKKYNIGYFLYIGGNDSMDTVDKLRSIRQVIILTSKLSVYLKLSIMTLWVLIIHRDLARLPSILLLQLKMLLMIQVYIVLKRSYY